MRGHSKTNNSALDSLTHESTLFSFLKDLLLWTSQQAGIKHPRQKSIPTL
eukprot:m.252187 g.252187  ORF g.252187 m.252187 type:complete len:50 (+) comp104445_c0_seq1:67-216(+)